MKKLNICIFLSSMVFFPWILLSQTQDVQENLQKYWYYKTKFLRYFTKVGLSSNSTINGPYVCGKNNYIYYNDGGWSLPASEINANNWRPFIWSPQERLQNVKYGDCTVKLVVY